MKALALVEGADHVCYRYRIEAFAWALAERGLRLEASVIHRGWLGRIGQLAAAGRADVVILQRKLLPIWQLQILRRSAGRLVYDVDDAVFQRDSYHRKPAASRQRLARFWATVYAADVVTAGNEYLRKRVAGYVGPDRVHAIPTCVEPRRYPSARHAWRGADVRLVWIGQQSTLPSLDHAHPQLAAAGRDLPGLALWVICGGFPRLSGVKVVGRRWSSATEAADLAECDIGISWLPDDPWSRGKCGLKVLQYMAAGLPVVANPVGMNCEMVAHGRTGFLASTPEEWASAIGRLAADPDLRRRMGAAARRVVEGQYSVARWGPEFAEVVAGARCRTARIGAEPTCASPPRHAVAGSVGP